MLSASVISLSFLSFIAQGMPLSDLSISSSSITRISSISSTSLTAPPKPLTSSFSGQLSTTANVSTQVAIPSSSSVASTTDTRSHIAPSTAKASSMSSIVKLLPTSSAPTPASNGDQAIFADPSGQGFSDTPYNSITRPLVMAYYPDWTTFPPEKINFTNFDIIDFAFALPTSTYNLTWDDPKAPKLLGRLVTAAHNAGKLVKLSVGGWTGSKYFSPAVSTDKNRQTFVASIAAAYEQYSLDGIEIDWEYQGREGETGNIYNSNDTANFRLFLMDLRQALPASAKITAAVSELPFIGPYGYPMDDVSEFASLLDWVLLMNYDVWSSSPTPGPNAPLYDGCGNSTQPDANAVAALKAWTNAGFPKNQLVLGLPSYGYLSNSNATSLRTRTISRFFSRHDSLRVTTEDGDEGQLQFRDLVLQGALARAADGSFVGSSGFERHWDSCSATPFLTSVSSEQVISYDDAESLKMKAEFVRETGMFGVNLFDIHGDTDEGDLLSAIWGGLGYSE